MTLSDFLRRAELALAVLLSATALFLLIVRATHAGALWRDECAVVNLARMPALADIARNFQREAFPLPFPIVVRGYTNVVGTSDLALRCFGIALGGNRVWFVGGIKLPPKGRPPLAPHTHQMDPPAGIMLILVNRGWNNRALLFDPQRTRSDRLAGIERSD